MSHQASKEKPRSSKCCHFCLPFDSHNYCPTCREANKGDDPCVTLEKLREEMQSMKKASEAEVDKTSASLSKAGPSKQPDPTTRAFEHSDARPMDTDLYGPFLPPRFTHSVQSDHGSKHSDLQSDHLDPHSEHSEQPKRVCSKAKIEVLGQEKHKVRQNTILLRSLLYLNRLLMSMINNRIAQTQFFTGR